MWKYRYYKLARNNTYYASYIRATKSSCFVYAGYSKTFALGCKAMYSLMDCGTLYLFISIRGRYIYTRRESGFERETKKGEREELRWTDNAGTRAERVAALLGRKG